MGKWKDCNKGDLRLKKEITRRIDLLVSVVYEQRDTIFLCPFVPGSSLMSNMPELSWSVISLIEIIQNQGNNPTQQ